MAAHLALGVGPFLHQALVVLAERLELLLHTVHVLQHALRVLVNVVTLTLRRRQLLRQSRRRLARITTTVRHAALPDKDEVQRPLAHHPHDLVGREVPHRDAVDLLEQQSRFQLRRGTVGLLPRLNVGDDEVLRTVQRRHVLPCPTQQPLH